MSPLTEPTKLTLAKGQPVPNDPYLYTNTVLLLHGDGANGSTNIVDSSRVAGSPTIVTPVGDAQISTAVADPFGNSTRGVLAFDGLGTPRDRLTIPTDTASLQFGAGDFTIECWIYRLNTDTAAIIVGQSDLLTIAGSAWVFYVSSSATSEIYAGSARYSVASPNPSINTWAHIALSRSGGTLRSFLNGTVVGTNTNLGASTVNIGATTYPNTIGSFGNNTNALTGYIDELRITKGVARYTSNFTPPTAPFPDF